MVKVDPRQRTGGVPTDPGRPARPHRLVYAMRDLIGLRRMAADDGEAIGVDATALLDIPLPWT